MPAYWGLLGPGALGVERRMRTLGLGPATRTFGELAVPGTGGIWFAKQLVLALLGIAVAERARARGYRVNNIETANALEAVGCWCALNDNGWRPDDRLLGRIKFRNRAEDDFSFPRARKPGFYVSLPMRMRTVQPLLALGLVEGRSQRFNAYRCSEFGRAVIEAAFRDYRPRNRDLLDHLVLWVAGEESHLHTRSCRDALSPLEGLSQEARDLLRDCLVRHGEGSERRRAALDWSEILRINPERWRGFSCGTRPDCFDAHHWRDIHCGALFFNARDAAHAVLDELAVLLADRVSQSIPVDGALSEPVSTLLRKLQHAAQAFLSQNYDPTPGENARTFCSECCQPDRRSVLRSLIRRDDWQLRLRDDCIVPGPGFRADRTRTTAIEDEIEDDTDGPATSDIDWPTGISNRIPNLFYLNADLNGDLERWLVQPNGEGRA